MKTRWNLEQSNAEDPLAVTSTTHALQHFRKETQVIFHHIPSRIRPGWPVSVSAVISSSSLLSGHPGRSSSFWMIIQKLFWEPAVLHSMNVLEPIMSVRTKVFCKGVTWSYSKISLFLLWLRRVYPAVRRKYFISAVRSLFFSHCLYKFHCRVKGLEELTFLLILILCFFGLNLVSVYCLKVPVFVKKILILECMSFSS
jgi:hypothetical protein